MSLRNKKGVVLALAGLIALGGIGGSLAFVLKSAKQTGTFTGEEAVKMVWGEKDRQDLNITGLSLSTPLYRELSIITGTSDISNFGTGHVTFTLQETTATKKFINVEISNAPYNTEHTESNVIATLKDDLRSTAFAYDLNLSAGEPYKFYLKFYLNGSLEDNATPEGTFTISLANGAKASE